MTQRITIAGAGLVGCLLGAMLAKRGYRVEIFERRSDMRNNEMSAGRSINLALSDRGLRALHAAGLADDVSAIAIPMRGRMTHDVHGTQAFYPYGVGDQAINSVSRGELNKTLLSCAERYGARLSFDMRCTDVNAHTGKAEFQQSGTELLVESESDVLIGADGAFSEVRDKMIRADRMNYSQSFLEHGYKELHIPAGADGAFLLDKNALHIWPRQSYMMIALPNLDGSFTCTLFFPHEGSPSFQELTSPQTVQTFFEAQFPDAVPLMPSLVQDFFFNPEASLVTIRCSPWTRNGNVMLIGDAAHAIVPFYGQGMNAGFEDCRILLECLDATRDDWPAAMAMYEHLRKPAADAIADLAVDNFVEMRDKVADADFLLRKKIESYLHATYPDKFVPLYTMVTFSSDVPYNEAQRVSRDQTRLMDLLLEIPTVAKDWTSADAKADIDVVMSKRKAIVFTSGSPALTSPLQVETPETSRAN